MLIQDLFHMKLGPISREDILGELERGGFAAGTIGEEGPKALLCNSTQRLQTHAKKTGKRGARSASLC